MVSITLHRGSLSLSLSISRSSISSSNSYSSLEHLVPKPKSRSYTTTATATATTTTTTTTTHHKTIRLGPSAPPPPSHPPSARNLNSQDLGAARGQREKRRMAAKGSGYQPVEIEAKKSYGIGGAGNIRRPSEVIYPQRRNSDGTRRRSSVWSSMSISPGSSPEGKRNMLLNFFGRRNSTSDQTSGYREAHAGKVDFDDVDMGGQKKTDGK